MRGRGGCAWQVGVCVAGGMRGGGGACVAGEMATAADGTHPTEMHSCFSFVPYLISGIFLFHCVSLNFYSLTSNFNNIP